MPMVAAGVAAAVTSFGLTASAGLYAATGLYISAAAFSAAAYVGAAAVTVGIGMAAQRMLQPQVGAAGPTGDFKSDPTAPVRGVMGRMAIGGNRIFKRTWGRTNVYLTSVALLSLGPCQGVEQFRANNQAVSFSQAQGGASGRYAGHMWMTYRSGLPGQPALKPPAGVFIENPKLTAWTSAHRADGHLTAMWTLAQAEDQQKRDLYTQGEPDALWVGRWMKVYDDRKDSTRPGGLGSHRRDRWDTWEYSANPYLHALAWNRGHYALKTDGTVDFSKRVAGVGAPERAIDTAAYIEGANIADANGWAIAGEWSTSDDKWEVLSAMLQAGGGVPLNRGAQISCMVNTPRASIYTYTRNDLVGGATVKALKARRDRKNTVVPRYRSEAHGWEIVPAGAVTSSVYRTEDRGEPRTIEIEYSYVTSAKQAGELGAYDVANMREGLETSLPSKPHLLGLRAGDAFTTDLPELGLVAQKFIVQRRAFDPQTGVVTLDVLSETDAKHAWALGQTANPPPTPSLVGVDPDYVAPPELPEWTVVVRPPAGDGSQQPGFEVIGGSPAADASSVVMEHGQSPTGPWKQFYDGALKTTGRVPIDGLQPGETYYVAVRYRRDSTGALSERTIYGPYTAPSLTAGDTAAVGGYPASDLLKDVQSVETLAGRTRDAVAGLEQVYGDTASAAQSAADAAASQAGAAQAKADAVVARGEARTAAEDALAKAQAAAGSSAAADAAKTASETARDAAIQKALDAAGAAETAGAAQSAAETASAGAAAEALKAAQKAGEASGSAQAAAGSAGTASSKATEAETAAAAALASSVTATTAYQNTVIAGGNQGFEDGLTGWGPNIAADPGVYTDANRPAFFSTYQGRSNVVAITLGMGRRYTNSVKLYPIDTARKYRFRGAIYAGAGSSPHAGIIGYIAYDADNKRIGQAFPVMAGNPLPPNTGWHDRTSSIVTGEGPSQSTQFPPGTKKIQLHCDLNYYGQKRDVEMALDGIWIEDVTESEAAKSSATAAATSAASAAASETAAGQSATAANQSKLDAQTARAEASNSATNAAKSATTATGAAATATTQAGLATTARDQSQGHAAAASGSAELAGAKADEAGVSAEAARADRVAAEAAREGAEGSASASAESASSAAADKTAAGSSASAAQTARTGAETARGQAQTYASNASDSADDAAGSASTASQQAGIATTARNAAEGSADAAAGSASTASSKADASGQSASAAEAARVAAKSSQDAAKGSADAASTSASTAATKATEAGTSASAANTAKTAAETARSQAQTFRDEASDSADDANGAAATATQQAGLATTARNDAAGSASAALTSRNQASGFATAAETAAAASSASSVTATTAKDAAVAAAIAGFPDVIAADLLAQAQAGAPNSRARIPAAQVVNGVYTPPVGAAGGAYFGQYVPWEVGKVYEVVAEIEGVSATSGVPHAIIYGNLNNAAYALLAERNAGGWVPTPVGQTTRLACRIGLGVLPPTKAGFVSSNWTGATGAAWVNLGLLFNRTSGGGVQAGAQSRLTKLTIRDVTAVVAAEQTADKAVIQGGNQGFEDGLTGWGPYIAANPGVYTDADRPLFQSSYQGRAGAAVSTPGMGRRNLYSAKLYTIDTSRKYRIRTSVYVGPGGTARTYVGMRCLDAAALPVGGNSGLQYPAIGGTVLAGNSGWTDRTSGVLAGEGVASGNFNAGTKQIQLVAFLNYDNTPGTETAIDGIWLEDVTESENAKAQATASATSAANAAASATLAGEKATASQTSATAADTSRAQAQTAASQASQSETNAAGSAASASTAAQNAATSRDQASGFATAASGSASTASTKAGEAGTSAAAALASQVSASTAKGAAETARDVAQGKAGEAASSASAAATSASNAAASETAAGQKASAAEGSASTAATRAGEAQTYRSQAATSESNAAGSASAAAGSAQTASQASGTAVQARGDAQAAASTAQQARSDASGFASAAQISADLAAKVVLVRGNLIDNSTGVRGMEKWSGAGWTASTASDVAGPHFFANALPAGNLTTDYIEGIQGGQSYTLQADIRLAATGGSVRGLVEWFSATASLGFSPVAFTASAGRAFTPDAPLSGQLTSPSNATRVRVLFNPQGVTGLVSMAVRRAKLEWGALPASGWTDDRTTQSLASSLSVTAGVATDVQSRLASARFEVIAAAGNNPAQLLIRADTSGSLARMVASSIGFANVVGGQVVEVMRLIGGNVFITGKLYIGGSPGSGVGYILLDGPNMRIDVVDENSVLRMRIGKLD